MCMCSLVYGLISVVECLLENRAVLRPVSRFELLKGGGKKRWTGYVFVKALCLTLLSSPFSISLSTILVQPGCKSHTCGKYQRDSEH